MRAFTKQLSTELSMTLRRGESVLLTIGIPVILLLFFAKIKVSGTEGTHPITTVAPGIIALAIMSTSMVSLGISTGFERSYGVLKRLGTTPLGTSRLLGAKLLGVIVIEIIQVFVLTMIAIGLGWNPGVTALNILASIAAALLGSIAFGGLGLAMAGRLRGEVNLAAANGLYLLLLLLGGMVVPLSALPQSIRVISEFLPAAALSSVLHQNLGPVSACYSGAWIVLAAWALLTPLVATASFKFDAN